MPQITIDERELNVKFSIAEILTGMRSNFKIPLSDVRGAQVTDKTFWHHLGLRIPGTGLPPFLVAGTYVKKGDRAYVCWNRKHAPIEITLGGDGYNRLVLSAGTAEEAQALASRINAFVSGA